MSRLDLFSSPYPWLSCLLRHRDLCCDKHDLANLSSFSISVTIEFYQLAAFIIATEILPSLFHYVITGISLSPFLLYFSLTSMSRQRIPCRDMIHLNPMFCLSQQKLLFSR